MEWDLLNSLYNGTSMLSNNFINSIIFFLSSFFNKCSTNIFCFLNVISCFICLLGLSWMYFCHSFISFLNNLLFFFFDRPINCIIDLRLTFKFVQFICYFSLFPNFIRWCLLICWCDSSQYWWIWWLIFWFWSCLSHNSLWFKFFIYNNCCLCVSLWSVFGWFCCSFIMVMMLSDSLRVESSTWWEITWWWISRGWSISWWISSYGCCHGYWCWVCWVSSVSWCGGYCSHWCMGYCTVWRGTVRSSSVCWSGTVWRGSVCWRWVGSAIRDCWGSTWWRSMVDSNFRALISFSFLSDM